MLGSLKMFGSEVLGINLPLVALVGLRRSVTMGGGVRLCGKSVGLVLRDSVPEVLPSSLKLISLPSLPLLRLLALPSSAGCTWMVGCMGLSRASGITSMERDMAFPARCKPLPGSCKRLLWERLSSRPGICREALVGLGEELRFSLGPVIMRTCGLLYGCRYMVGT